MNPMKHQITITALLITAILALAGAAVVLASCGAGKVKVSVAEYDENGNEIHYKDIDGDEQWYDYDKGGNLIHRKNSNGYEAWWEYDENGSFKLVEARVHQLFTHWGGVHYNK